MKDPPGAYTDTVVIPAVLFDVNSAALKPAIVSILDSLAGKIHAASIDKIEINGHADNTGSVAKNEALSLARARSVKKYLDKKLPQLAARSVASGKGQRFPVADNNTEEGREKNRRVEIILTRVIKRE